MSPFCKILCRARQQSSEVTLTEREWLDCSRLYDVRKDKFVQRRETKRKWRLFEAACIRLAWDIMTDRRCREAVETAERFADGEVTVEELRGVHSAVRWRARDTTGYLAHLITQETV